MIKSQQDETLSYNLFNSTTLLAFVSDTLITKVKEGKTATANDSECDGKTYSRNIIPRTYTKEIRERSEANEIIVDYERHPLTDYGRFRVIKGNQKEVDFTWKNSKVRGKRFG